MTNTSIQHYGKDKPYQGKEDDFQQACMKYLHWNHCKLIPFHVPNGGYRAAKEGAKFKRLGVKSGVSDIIILEPNKEKFGLMIELKVQGGKLQDSQIEFLQKSQSKGYETAVVWNFDAFQELIKKYLSN